MQESTSTEHPLTFPDHTTNFLRIYRGKINFPVAIILPAMGIRSSYYNKFAKALSRQSGYYIAIIDYRGFGYSSVRASRKSDFGFSQWLKDLNFIISFLSKELGKNKFTLIGHSLGGQLGSLYYGWKPNQISHLVLIGSSLPYYKIWKWPGNIKLWFGGYSAPLIAKIIGYFPGEITGFAGNETQACIGDWARVVRTGQYNLIGDNFDYEKAIQEVDAAITAISFPEDNLAPPYSVPYLVNKFVNAKKIEYKIMTGFDHFDWTKKVDLFIKESRLFLST